MPDPFLAAEQVLVDYVRRHGSSLVIIASDGTRTAVTGNIGSTKHDQQGPSGRQLPATITRTTDFIVPTEDLPEDITASHRVEYNGHTYKPASVNGEPLSRDSGRHGLLTRIHTIRIG